MPAISSISAPQFQRMIKELQADVDASALLDHELNGFFPELRKFESSGELERSEIYGQIKPEVERILNAVVRESFADNSVRQIEGNDAPAAVIKAVAWNIERGRMLDGIINAIKSHPGLKGSDVLLLTELDYGMARSGNRFAAREIAAALRLNYAFVPLYIALQKGSGVEAQVDGENTNSIHGLAIFSSGPMNNVHSIALPNGKDKMLGTEKRLGQTRALFADIKHPAGDFRAVTTHLDAHCSRAHRRLQLNLILDHLETLPAMPTLIGGDWNTTTFNSQSATRAILGYWRRVFMGVENFVKNHVRHPERYFEKGLFDDLESRGYQFKNLNELGVGTLHYDIRSFEKNKNLRDWVPEWCFPFIFWAARRVGGKVSARLDWFAGRGIELVGKTAAKTVANLADEHGTPLSDHDAITLDFRPVVK